MTDMMMFPKTVDEFMEKYKIVDTDKVYTNGAELVPIFRMQQWFEHVEAEPVKQERCEFCKDGKTFWGAELILDNEGNWHNIIYCPICGAKMDEIEEEKTPKLIDANEILKSEHQHYAPMADEYYVPVRDIENAPLVDAVPVVRCEGCESSITPEGNSDEVYCTKHNNWFKINGYCHLGRKKKDEADQRR